jgi:putative flippase GtrA
MKQRLRSEASLLVKAQVSTVVATGLHWLLMTGLILTDVTYLVASPAGALLGAVTDFSIKKWWVFGAGPDILGRLAVRYAAVSAASAGFNVAASYGLVSGVGLPKVAGGILASILVGLAWNYPLHRLVVFGGPVSSQRR